MPAAFQPRNRSLKSELIFIDASCGCGRDHQVPGGFKDFRRTEFLPERDIELASGSAALYQPAHDHPVSHTPILSLSSGRVDIVMSYSIASGCENHSFFG